jgi:uncharacterized membrane protein
LPALLLTALCAGLAILIGNVVADVTDWSLPLLLVTSGLATAPVVWGLVKRRLDVFEPVVVLCGIYLLLYGLAALAYLAWGAPMEQPEPEAVATASCYCLLGLIFFYVGYYALSPGRTVAQHSLTEEGWSAHRLALICVILALIAVGATLVMKFVLKVNILVPESSSELRYGVYLLNLEYLYQVAFWIYLSHYLRRGGNRTLTWVFFLGGLGLYAFTKKVELVSYLLGVLVIYHYRGRRIRFGYVLAFAVAVMVFQGTAHLVDQAGRYRELTGGSLISELPPAAVFYSSTMREFEQFSIFVMLQVEIPRALPFQYGRTFWALPATPIPRRIWQDKPVSASGLVNYRLFPHLVEQGYGRAVSILGELFMNFAGWGIAGMVLFGILSRRLYQYLRARPASLWAPVVYAISLNALVSWLRDDIAISGSTFLLQMAALGAAALVLMPRPAGRGAP